MTANNPITHGERARLKTKQVMRRHIKELLGGAYDGIKSRNPKPTAEMLVAKLAPQAEAICPQNFNSKINKTKQNNQQNYGDQNIGVFNITYEDEKQDDNDDRQDDDCERQNGGQQKNDGDNQNIGVFTITFEGEEQNVDEQENVHNHLEGDQ